MGFAGQVFAARVAVGLAVPSQQSLNKAGGLIARSVGGIYTKMRQKKIEAAKQNLSATQKGLDEHASKVEAFQKKTTGKLWKSSNNTIMKLKGLAKGGELAMETGGAIAKLKKGMDSTGGSEAFSKLFKGIKTTGKAAHTEFQQMVGMMGNFNKLNAQQKEEVIGFLKDRELMQKRVIKQTAEDVKAGKATVEQLRKEAEVFKVYKEEREEMEVLARDYKIVVAALAKEEAELNDEERELLRLHKKHEKAFEDLTVDTKRYRLELMQLTGTVVNQLKRGFTDAVRESVAALTAFYYKLNQSTQELIEFEAELLNANSVWNETRETLFDTSDMIVQFGQQFGMEMQNGATGLYQLASAGLTASESMTVLPETLKLSMAVQGDHNTIAKLTTQTIKGFDMEMNQAAEVTDKFAHAIQKSLIEYEDLSSAVKFALPFFTATGQSIDQLLGALQVLTNRALEAGIAGRGLRQALAEFAENAEDNTAAFRQMGIEITNADGSMKQLTEIAQLFAQAVGDDVINNTELLTTLIDDLNVRGATAFIHLVQNADEFRQAVDDTANSGGELDEMVRIQNESMKAQIQILKNNVQMMFFMSDGQEYASGAMNRFHDAVLRGIESLQKLLVVEKDGAYVMTEFGANVQEVAIRGVQLMTDLLKQAVVILRQFADEGAFGISILHMYAIPLKMVAWLLMTIPSDVLKLIVAWHLLNKVLGIGIMLSNADNISKGIRIFLLGMEQKEELKKTAIQEMSTWALWKNTAASEAGIFASIKSIFVKKKETTAKVQDTAATHWNTIAETLGTIAKWAMIAAVYVVIAVFRPLYTAKKLYTWWTTSETVATNMATISKWLYSIAAWAVIGVLMLTAPLFGLITLAIGLYTGTVTLGTIGTSLLTNALWAVTMVPIVALVVAIGLAIVAVIYGLYKMNQEFDVTGKIWTYLGEVWASMADGMRSVWEDVIYPLIYRLGMEFIAIIGIIYFMISNPMLMLEKAWNFIWEKGIQPVLNGIKMVVDGIIWLAGEIMENILKPAWEGFANLVSSIFEGMKQWYNDWIVPIWEGFLYYINLIKDAVAGLNLGNILKAGLDSAVGLLKEAWGYVQKIKGSEKKRKEAKDKSYWKGEEGLVPDWTGWAGGGYMKALAGGGSSGKLNIVGEKGPELFMPNVSGRVISNKDLNSGRALDMLQSARMRGAAGVQQGQHMKVESLSVGKLSARNSSVGINAFKGDIGIQPVINRGGR